MSGGAAAELGDGGGDPFAEPEEHENHERYLITYADMITLLMALFIILFAIGQVDQDKFDAFRGGLHEAFDNPLLPGAGSILDTSGDDPVPVGLPAEPGMDGPTGRGPRGAEGFLAGHVSLEEAGALAGELEALLDEQGLDPVTDVHVESEGIVVSIDTDGLVFASGSASLLPTGEAVVARLGPPLAALTNDIVVQGHTDSVPMTGGTTNWELSAGRAAAVLHRLTASGVSPDRLSMAGYADTRPIASNDTAEGRAANRRVDIVVVLDGADPGDGAVVPMETIGGPLDVSGSEPPAGDHHGAAGQGSHL